MSLKMANKVLRQIGESGVSGAELVVANRLKAYKRARVSGDVSGMMEAAKAVARIGEEHTLTTEGEDLIEEIVDDALDFAEKVATGFEDEAEAEDEGGDGRDFFGRRVRPLDEAGDGQDEDEDEEDGRDMYGRRIGG